ncbi:hypothetical protein GpartN1_g6973.t1 [Galdieria partita]|uniref:Tetraspanin n=1 Tax=Galdieria partita TaxID=83374 RepID=A0A9C7Q3Z6_9RHOD|nr:hypothetical protein GpartN1_g6973.t1 [Galdieria partita]
MGKGSLFVVDTFLCSKALAVLSIATSLSGLVVFILGIWIYVKEGRVRSFVVEATSSNQVGVDLIEALGKLPIGLIVIGVVVFFCGIITCCTSQRKGRIFIPLNTILLSALFLGVLIISIILYVVPKLIRDNSTWQKSFELNVWVPSVKQDPSYVYQVEQEFSCAGFNDGNCATKCSTPPSTTYSSSYACYFNCPGLSSETNSTNFPEKQQASSFESAHEATGCFQAVIQELVSHSKDIIIGGGVVAGVLLCQIILSFYLFCCSCCGV